jgi:hypothetical protein
MFAFASHMVTSATLLDARLALRAFLHELFDHGLGGILALLLLSRASIVLVASLALMPGLTMLDAHLCATLDTCEERAFAVRVVDLTR